MLIFIVSYTVSSPRVRQVIFLFSNLGIKAIILLITDQTIQTCDFCLRFILSYASALFILQRYKKVMHLGSHYTIQKMMNTIIIKIDERQCSQTFYVVLYPVLTSFILFYLILICIVLSYFSRALLHQRPRHLVPQ